MTEVTNKTEPTGSQMFWVTVAISLYTALWVYVINNPNEDKSNIFLTATFSFVAALVHSIQYLAEDYTNPLHKLNPIIIMYYLGCKLANLIKTLNSYLDKIHD